MNQLRDAQVTDEGVSVNLVESHIWKSQALNQYTDLPSTKDWGPRHKNNSYESKKKEKPP